MDFDRGHTGMVIWLGQSISKTAGPVEETDDRVTGT